MIARRSKAVALVGLLAVVFVLKLVVLLQLKDHPLLHPDAGLDTTTYAQLARQVVAGDVGLGPGLYYVLPLYIYVLAGALAVFDSFTAARVVQIVLGTLSVGCIFLTARTWFGERAAWLAAGFAALTGLFTFYEVVILQSSIDAFLTSAALLCLTWALSSANGTRWLILSGVIFGIQTLNRPNVLLAAAGIVAVLLLTRRLRFAALLVAGLVAGMAPVAVRNVVVAHQWSLVSSHGGLNLYIGNSETATGFYHQVPGIRPTIAGQEEDVRRVAEQALGHRVTDAEASDYFVGLAMTWVRQHPLDAIGLFARKLFYVFNAQHVALPHSYPFYAYDAGTALRFYAIGPWLLIPLGLVGLFRTPSPESQAPSPEPRRSSPEPRAPSPYYVWVSFVPFYAAAVALFFVAERYRLPLLPSLCVGAGAALDAAIRLVQEKRWRALAMPAVAFVVLFAIANWRTGLHDGRWEEGLRLAQRLVILGRVTEAEEWAQRIEPNELRPGATAYGIGMQLLLGEQAPAALTYLTTAQRLDPGQPNVEYGLGQALLKAGRPQDALPHLRRGFEAGIELPLGGFDYAVALNAAGDKAGAASAARAMRPPNPDDPEGWLKLGRMAAEMKAPDVAEPFFRRAVEMRPDQASARQQLGLNLLVLGRCEDAAAELAAAVRLDARDPDSLSHLAYCEARLGRLAEARAHAEAALAINAADPLARQLIAALVDPRRRD